MTFDEKMKALTDVIYDVCEMSACCYCRFMASEDALDDDGYCCSIRDNSGLVPWRSDWDVKEALGIGEYKPSPFPEKVTNSMMQHFTKVE